MVLHWIGTASLLACLFNRVPGPIKQWSLLINIGEHSNGHGLPCLDAIFGSEACEKVMAEQDDAVVKRMVDPKLPSQDEVDRHCVMGHLPYRSWCPVCVKAKGRDMDHSRDSGKERKVSEYSWDYCFPGDELGFKWIV